MWRLVHRTSLPDKYRNDEAKGAEDEETEQDDGEGARQAHFSVARHHCKPPLVPVRGMPTQC